jgi:Spy/CpxP family protein refolding chaperone
MKRFTTTILILSLSGALFAAGPKGDWDKGRDEGPGGPGGPRDGRGMMMNIVKDLNLSKDQLKKAEYLRKDQEKEGREMGDELLGRHQELRKELAKVDMDDRKVDGLVNRLSDDQKRMLQLHVKYAREYKKILTPEQRLKLYDNVEKMESKMQERHAGEGMMGGFMGGPRHRMEK